MHRSQDALTALAGAAIAALASGCGAMINGPMQTVEITTADPKAEILMNGTVLSKGSASVTGSPSFPPVVYVRDSSGGLTRHEVSSSVSGAAIALDILCSLTIIGIAAPISDGLLDTFRGLDPPEAPIAVNPPPKRAARTVEYATNHPPSAAMYRP